MVKVQQLEKVKQLMAELHSFAGLIQKIESAGTRADTSELEKLQLQLSRGLDVACELTKALNQTALALHVELLARKSPNPKVA